MKDKNKTLLMVLGVLLVVGIGVSFAYFAVGVTIGGEGSNTNLGTGTFPLVQYDAGDSKLLKENLMPKDIITKDFKVIVTPTKDIKEVTYRIYIDISENTFVKCTEANYVDITNECEINAEELIYRLKDSSGNVIKTGDLTGRTGQIELVRETKTQESKTEYNYTIEIEYKDTNKDQNHNANKTFNGNIKVEYAEQVITIPDIIAAVNPKSTTPDFSQAATTDEGVYAVSDEMYGGTSYYWRGAVTNNYVKFANFCWRIVRINGDGSIRLIYDGTTCHANGANTAESIAVSNVQYNSSYNNSSYVGWTYTASSQRPSGSGTASNAKTQLESWYNSNITGTNASKVADGKYCNDRTSITSSGGSYTWAATGSTFFYAAYHRINTGAPILSCPNGDIYSLNVGLITADEAMYAGGKFANNTSYYLYNGQNYWTMSPYQWYRFTGNNYARLFRVTSDGHLEYAGVNGAWGLRPVINLKADTLFATGGNGTQSNPYEAV